MLKLIIKGTLPGLNEYIEAERRNKYLGAKMKRQTEQVVILCAKSQLRRAKFDRPVFMRYTWYEKNRRRDKSNICGFGRKVIEDGLIKAGVLRNDGWNEIEGFSDRFFVDKKNPRIEVEFEEMET